MKRSVVVQWGPHARLRGVMERAGALQREQEHEGRSHLAASRRSGGQRSRLAGTLVVCVPCACTGRAASLGKPPFSHAFCLHALGLCAKRCQKAGGNWVSSNLQCEALALVQGEQLATVQQLAAWESEQEATPQPAEAPSPSGT